MNLASVSRRSPHNKAARRRKTARSANETRRQVANRAWADPMALSISSTDISL